MTAIYGLHRARKITPILGEETSGVASILLYGPRGCGKTLLVNQLAETWLASENDPTNRAVESFRRGANPDFFHVARIGTAVQILVGQIRPQANKTENFTPITEFIRVSPLYSRNKVIWIEDAHRLHPKAFNALLKTLEEPPAYVKLILTTSEISQIPATILSRCLVVNCELPTAEELYEHYPGIPSDILGLADGAPGTLERISANPDLYTDVVRFGDRLVREGRHGALVLGEEYRKLADRLEEIEKQGARNSNARMLELIAISISKRHPQRADIVRMLTDAHRRILGNANPALVLDATMGRIVLANNAGTN